MTEKKIDKEKIKGFTDDEKAAMKTRAQELKAGASGNKNTADGERDVLAKIAEMSEPDRGMANRLHEIIKANAPSLSPKTWYGMPVPGSNPMIFLLPKNYRAYMLYYLPRIFPVKIRWGRL